jgi:hypothetical protein
MLMRSARCFPLFQFLKKLTDYKKTWCERYAIVDYPNVVVLNSLQAQTKAAGTW